MAFKTITMRLVVCSIGLACTGLMAQTGKDLGKREYDNNCASCHGLDGKGHGVFVEWLKRSPPDLTSLSRRNAGVFPMANVYDVVEGAGPGHGTREMPVWGRDYSVKAAEYYVDVPYSQEGYVRARILALCEYINRLQTR
ncbi:MAG: cytochrome c [Rubrivivax sp.]|nr:cytochrome c [Rubrivivax sp.]